MFEDYPELPDFLNRKLNGIVSIKPSHVRIPGFQGQKLITPRKKNWRKIEQQRREKAKREGTAIKAGSMRKQKGQ